MPRLLLAVAMLVGLMSACGDGTKTSTIGDASQPACVEERHGPVSLEEAAAMSAAQTPLRGDMEKLRAYGAAHADEFTELAWDNEPTVKLVGYFTGHLDEHRAALEAELKHPDKLELRESLQSDRARKRIMDSLDFDSGLFTGAGGRPIGTVHVEMRATAEARDTADALRAEWGDLVCLTVGGHPYPPGAWPDGARCPTTPAPTDRNPSVDFTLTLDKTTLRRGEIGAGTARIQNNGTTTIDVTTGTNIGANVTKPGSNQIVAGLTEFSDAAGRLVRAEPGKTEEIPVRFGTEDCAPNSDYSLPPGDYVVSSYVKEFGRSDDVTITIVE